MLSQQLKTDLSVSAIKNLAATSFTWMTRVTDTKAAWKSTKQPHPRCEKYGKLVKMRVVKNLLKPNYGRPLVRMLRPVNSLCDP